MTNKDKSQLFLGLAIFCLILAIVVPLGLVVSNTLSSDTSCGAMEEREKLGISDELKEICDEENAKEQRNIAIGFGVFIVPALGLGIASWRVGKNTEPAS